MATTHTIFPNVGLTHRLIRSSDNGAKQESRYSAVAHLASAIHPASSVRKKMLMLTAYFDETGRIDDPALNFTGMGGLLADSGAWIVFEERWRDALKKAELAEPFHMKDFAHSLGQFASWKGNKARREALYGHLISLILETGAIPIAAIVKISDFTGLTKTQQNAFVDPYYLTLQTVTRGAAHEGLDLFRESKFEKVAMVYAKQEEYSGTAERIWYATKDHYEYGHCLGSYSTSTPGDLMPLQAADIFAYEVFKEFENRVKRPNDPMRWGLRKLLSLARMPPPKIMLFDRKELLRITKQSNFPDQSNVEEVADDQMESVMESMKRWSVERGGMEWNVQI